MAKMKVSFVRLLHVLQFPDPQQMCWEQIHVRVWRQLYSHHVVIRRKMELQEFWIQNQLLSTSSSYSSSIQFTCSDRTCIQKIFVCDGRCHCSMGEEEASFCPNALLPIEGPLCNLDHFLCHDGSCTPYTDVCNGRWDCKKWRWRRSLLLNVPYARTPRSSQIPINGRNVIVHEAVLSTFTRWSYYFDLEPRCKLDEFTCIDELHSSFENVQRKTAACKGMTRATSAQLMLQAPSQAQLINACALMGPVFLTC